MPDYTILPLDRPRGEAPADAVFRPGTPCAMAYVPVQPWEGAMCAEDALGNGTAFRALVMPFEAAEAAHE